MQLKVLVVLVLFVEVLHTVYGSRMKTCLLSEKGTTFSRFKRQSSYLPYLPRDKNILKLTGRNLAQNVLNSDKGHFVEFYSHSCGSCIAYAPIFRRFAERVQDWKDVGAVGAVNCANENDNEDVCNQNGVYYTPVIKYFPRNARRFSEGTTLSAYSSSQKTWEQLAENILKDYQSDPTSDSGDSPNFTPLPKSVTKSTELWRNLPQAITHFALFQDSSGWSTMGVQTLLDMWSERSWLSARRAERLHPLDTFQDLHLNRPPYLLVFKRGSSRPVFQKRIDGWSVDPTVLKIVKGLKTSG